VREIRFEDFSKEKGKHTLFMFASKTGKRAIYDIPQPIFEIVEEIKKQRAPIKGLLSELRKALAQEKDEGKKIMLERKIAIAKRRYTYLFSFFRGGAVHKRFKLFKEFLVGMQVAHAEQMIIHDIRKIVLRQTHESRGVKAATKLAQHANMQTTLKHYLEMK
jgi:integrase